MAKGKKTEAAPLDAKELVDGALEESPAVEDVPEELPGCQEVGPAYRVAWCQRLNLRAAPDRRAAVWAVLPAGTQMEVSMQSLRPDGAAAWVAVCAGELGGWVDARYLQRVEE